MSETRRISDKAAQIIDNNSHLGETDADVLDALLDVKSTEYVTESEAREIVHEEVQEYM